MNKKAWIWITAAVLVVAAISFGYFNDQKETAQTSKMEQTKTEPVTTAQQNKYPVAPDFALKDLKGKTVRLSDYKGKIVIIDFWATWCGPCRRGIPDFIELQKEYGEEKLQILGVSVDRGDLSVVPKFAKEYNMNYPVLYADSDVQMKYGPIRSIPTAFIVDQDGYVRDMRVGLYPKEYFVEVVNLLLKS